MPVTIVLAADKGFCRQLAVALTGISRVMAGVPSEIFVLHDGYDEVLQAKTARAVAEEVELRWIDARSALLDSALLPAYLPTAALYRLRIEELLPTSVDRLIYLDSDIALRDCLGELWAHELGDHLLAAVRDPVAPWMASPRALDWRVVRLGARHSVLQFRASCSSLWTGGVKNKSRVTRLRCFARTSSDTATSAL